MEAITRQQYLELSRRMLARIDQPAYRPLWEGASADREWFGADALQSWLATAYAILGSHGGDAADLQAATTHLLAVNAAAQGAQQDFILAYRLLENHLSADEKARAARAFVASIAERHAKFIANLDVESMFYVHNHALNACLQADLALTVFPAVAEENYRQWTDPLWGVFWRLGDFLEMGPNYEGQSELGLIAWAETRCLAAAFFERATVRRMFERALGIVSPDGVIAAYGDCGDPARPAVWMALFEKVARETGDGRFRRAAADIAGWYLRRDFVHRTQPLEGLLEMPPSTARSVAKCYLYEAAKLAMAGHFADETVPVEPRRQSLALRRHAPRVISPDRTMSPAPTDRESLVGQVALAGGPEPRTWLLLSVGRRLTHDHADAGAIHLLARGDSKLLSTNGYLLRELYYHNVLFVQPADRPRFPDDRPDLGIIGDDDSGGRLLALETTRDTATCRLCFDDYHGQGVRLDREVRIDAAGVVTLRDELTVTGDRTVQAGMLLHGETLDREATGVYRLRLETLRSLNGEEIPNAPGALRVTFADGHGEVTVRHLEEPGFFRHDLSARPPDYLVLWQNSYLARQCLATTRRLAPGQTATLITRLEPLAE